jgi:cytochrome c-type biogenesis protein CcmH
MSPAMTLSTHPLVVVGARISKSGNAMPSPGDLSGQVTNVKTGTSGLAIVIDTVQP